MKCSIFLIFLLYSLTLIASEQKARQLIKGFDTSRYAPQIVGLRNFKVDIRIDGLSEKLSQQLIFGKVKDVFFEMSWLRGKDDYSSLKKVDVFGLPSGFFEIKSELANNILPKIDSIVPPSWSEKMKDYKLTMTLNKDGSTTIVGRDPQGVKEANEIILVFDNQKKPKSFIMKKPIGLETVDLVFFKKPWSRGKWVVKEYRVKKSHGIQKIESQSTFHYRRVQGFGLPEKIETTTKQVLNRPSPGKKSETYERKGASTMKLSNWRINTGLKKDHFRR
ncbi:MAG: hypothetical protein OXB88_03440 [Bacteriovoracales bacterium]|nr:hypothetical protein [Bacteriovoracales bacterium]